MNQKKDTIKTESNYEKALKNEIKTFKCLLVRKCNMKHVACELIQILTVWVDGILNVTPLMLVFDIILGCQTMQKSRRQCTLKYLTL